MSRTPVTFGKKDYISQFKRRYPAVQLDPALHLSILKACGQAIADCLLTDGHVKMGSRLGDLTVRKFIPKGKGANFVATTKKYESAKQGKAVYEFNDHTGGYIYRFLWNKRKCKGIEDKNMWVFKPIRSLKRNLAYRLINKMVDFPTVQVDQDIFTL